MLQRADFFVFRRPLASVDALHSLYQSLRNGSVTLPDALRQWFSDPLHQQALETASPQLYARVRRWLVGEALPDEAKIVSTLHKYLIRMTTRSTPYGLFAGCTLGTVGTVTRFEVAPPEAIAPHARLDIECLQSIKNWLMTQPDIRQQLRLYPNTTLYPAGTYFRFIEQQREATGRTYFISAISSNELLADLFAQAKPGLTDGQLAEFLNERYQVSDEDARQYINELVDSQLLVVELEPTLTGIGYLAAMQQRLTSLIDSPAVENARRVITEINRRLAVRPLNAAALTAYLTEQGIELPPTDFVQIDMALPADVCQLSEQWFSGLQRQLQALLVLNQPLQSDDLDEFRRRFYNRYEDEEVPLALALDHEMGVGFGTTSSLGVGSAPMIDSLSLPGGGAQSAASLTPWQLFVLNRYTEALRYGQREIVLTDADLRQVDDSGGSQQALPSSFYAFGTVLSSSAQAVDEADSLFLLTSCKGPSAVNLISRFADTDPALAAQIRACARLEEESHPDVILAEIVHFPESRAGNILNRPTLHQYEIPYLGRASVDPEYQIPLSDLYLSVRNDRLVLRSKRLDKRVIPRLSNAHNFGGGLPVYQFLCTLQYQDAYLDLRWNWGLLARQSYLPRVRYGRIVLSRATWQLRADQLALDNPARLREQLHALGLPPQFMISNGDNELTIDLATEVSIQLFGQELRRAGTLRVVECLTTPDCCPVRDAAGRAYAHELVLPFRNLSAPAYAPIRAARPEPIQRRFSVGSEWLYLKIYAGEKAADTILTNSLYPAIRELIDQQTVQQFFFIRYKDQDPHLRLRFRGNPHMEFYHYVIRRIERALQPYVQSGLVHRIQTDTYQRELERYGVESMIACEDIFHHDSLSTLQFMSQTGEAFDENLRFAFAAHKIDRLLNGLGMTITGCHELLDHLKEQFFAEFRGDAALRQQLNDRYRTYKPLIEQALSRPFPLGNGLENWVDRQQPTLVELGETNRSDRFRMTGSLVHMTINRLFPSKQRAYELVLYHCLAKFYDSQRARQKQ